MPLYGTLINIYCILTGIGAVMTANFQGGSAQIYCIRFYKHRPCHTALDEMLLGSYHGFWIFDDQGPAQIGR